MYLSFYGLYKKPFQVSTDPSFLWLGEKHKEALATLKYGNLGNQGFILLTGDVGTGKTTLINALINSLGDDVIAARVPDPGMEIIDFMNYIAHAFGMNKRFTSKDAFLIDFDQFLNNAHAAGKKSLLIIDEAQRLSSALLEEIRQLSNIERQDTKLLSIFLVGQNEFNDVLLEHKNRALRQRITLNYVINPLDVHETGEFIRHRLRVAGAETDIFSADAIRKVHELSGGFPRKVNIICDHSLLQGFADNVKTVTGEIVEECVKDYLLPEVSKIKNNEHLPPAAAADAENIEEIAPEPLQEIPLQKVNSRKNWKTFSTVILIAMAVAIVAFIMYQGKNRDLLSHNTNNEVQSHSGDRTANTLNANNSPEPIRATTSSPEGAGPDPKKGVTDQGTKEVLTAEEPTVEEVKPVIAVSADERADIVEQTPSAPELPDKETGIPGDEKSGIVTSSSQSSAVDSPSILPKKIPSNEKKTPEFPNSSKADTIENKEPENVDSGALIDWVIKKRSK